MILIKYINNPNDLKKWKIQILILIIKLQLITKLGEKINTQILLPYEQKKLMSKTDWRIKAIIATFIFKK